MVSTRAKVPADGGRESKRMDDRVWALGRRLVLTNVISLHPACASWQAIRWLAISRAQFSGGSGP